jgi:diamine N-acetyltransferase
MAPSSVLFRPCGPADLETLRALAWRTYDETFRHVNTAETMDAYLETAFARERLEKELRNPLSSFQFLYSDGRLAGYLKLNEGEAQTEGAEPGALEIERIYVERGFQGLGLGAAMVDRAVEIARRKGKTVVWLGVWERNENAIGFYRKMGFRKAGTHVFVMGGARQTDWIMRRVIA